MKRKVIQLAGRTLIISLPSKWTKKYNVKKGDEINVDEDCATLKVSPIMSENSEKQVSVDVSGLSADTVKSLLCVLHKNGYDEVEILFNDPKILKIIQKRIQNTLIGYEIVEQSKKRCLVKIVSGDQAQEFENILNRTFLVTLNFARSIENEIEEKGKDFAEFLSLEETNNKLTNYLHRLLNKGAYTKKTVTFLYLIIWLMESIADDYRDLCKFLDCNKNIQFNDKDLLIYKSVRKLLEDYYHLFYNLDIKKVDKFRADFKKVNDSLIESLGNKNSEKLVFYSYLQKVAQHIYDGIGSVTAMIY